MSRKANLLAFMLLIILTAIVLTGCMDGDKYYFFRIRDKSSYQLYYEFVLLKNNKVLDSGETTKDKSVHLISRKASEKKDFEPPNYNLYDEYDLRIYLDNTKTQLISSKENTGFLKEWSYWDEVFTAGYDLIITDDFIAEKLK